MPYGKWTLPTVLLACLNRVSLGWWTHDSGDTRAELPASPDAVASRLVEGGGGVLLMHDFDRQGDDATERESFVLETTRAVIKAAKRQDIQVCTLGEVMAQQESERNFD